MKSAILYNKIPTNLKLLQENRSIRLFHNICHSLFQGHNLLLKSCSNLVHQINTTAHYEFSMLKRLFSEQTLTNPSWLLNRVVQYSIDKSICNMCQYNLNTRETSILGVLFPSSFDYIYPRTITRGLFLFPEP